MTIKKVTMYITDNEGVVYDTVPEAALANFEDNLIQMFEEDGDLLMDNNDIGVSDRSDVRDLARFIVEHHNQIKKLMALYNREANSKPKV